MNARVTTSGIHHVTAIAGDPQRNADFYVETLGLRFVKKTVNHDDRYTYHFYFGDGEGRPGTNVTFFPWGESGRTGTVGTGQVATMSFLVPEGSLSYWRGRLESAGVEYDVVERFDERALTFADPDGIGLELVATEETLAGRPWERSPVPGRHQIRGFRGVTLALADGKATADVLSAFGFELTDETDDRWRYRADRGDARGIGAVVDLVEGDGRGRQGVGTVHHVALAARDGDHQRSFREVAADLGLGPTDVIDRTYFESIYFREPGGVLVEVATDGPGFTVDEDLDSLGEGLALPEWLEDEREEIRRRLPELRNPLEAGEQV